ncbi:hypothetical protein [uncultured Pantoea sp.]|uniref:hypothetical protein n=1 Tax=uncultured Pantoea sp. TaxID=218084 RepID=UPI0027D9618C|nr:hypothetical protein [uncultured Pantoea sp.]
MKPFNEEILSLVILFIVCILGVIISFLCIALPVDVLVWILTGSFDLKKADILKTINIGCVVAAFTGAVFVFTMLFRLKGF